MLVESRLTAYARSVDLSLDRFLPAESEIPADLHKAMRYACLAPGKRLRPALCLGAAEALGADPSAAMEAACALEMVHCFSLIHDDLPSIDDDDLRRGRPTTHKVFGEGLAMLAGDALFALAFQVLASSKTEPTIVSQAIQILANASGSRGLVGGEVMDVLAEGKPVDDHHLKTIHVRKTGLLLSASCELGGLFAGADQRQQKALALYGLHLGLAFQIADDILNVTSSAEKLGKAANSNSARQKATYPALYGLDGAKDRALKEAAEAKAALQDVGIDSAFLTEMADYAIHREA